MYLDRTFKEKKKTMKISLSGLSNEYQTSWKFSVLRGKNKIKEKKIRAICIFL
jgi:hypothetical protein